MTNPIGQAHSNWRQMKAEWDKVRTSWRDNTTAHFEKKYWDRLDDETRVFLKEIEGIARNLDEIGRVAKD